MHAHTHWRSQEGATLGKFHVTLLQQLGLLPRSTAFHYRAESDNSETVHGQWGNRTVKMIVRLETPHPRFQSSAGVVFLCRCSDLVRTLAPLPSYDVINFEIGGGGWAQGWTYSKWRGSHKTLLRDPARSEEIFSWNCQWLVCARRPTILYILSAEDMRCWNLSQSQRKPAPAAHTSANPSRVNRYLAQHLLTTRSIPISDSPIPFPIYFLFISYSISYSFPIGNFLFPIHFHDLEEENLHFFNNAKMNRK